jgi:DNA-binding NarL/FixJ family response regulator
LAAIRFAHAGRYYFSKIVNLEGHQGDLNEPSRESDSMGFDCLSGREKEVFFLFIEGYTTSQIADVLYRSPKTVEKHRASISKKLGVASPVEMMKFAIRCGVVDPDCWKN